MERPALTEEKPLREGAALVRLRIEKLVAGGDGLAFHEGKAVFVPMTAPGDLVLAQLESGRKDYATAQVQEILEASKDRIDPACALYGSCGGCNLMHIRYPAQVECKRSALIETFRRLGHVEPGELAAVPSVPFAYRNRMQFHVDPEGRIGLMRRGSLAIESVSTCPVAAKAIQTWLEERAGKAVARGELAQALAGKDRFLVFGDAEKVYVEGRADIVELELLGSPIRFRLKGFFQSNLYMLEYLVPDALGSLSGERAADLYCGVGLFGRELARRFKSVSCVELDPYALELAKENVRAEKAEFHALALEDWIRTKSARGSFDCVLLDPPRSGIAPSARAWLAEKRVRDLVYVSCDPASLARDAGELCRAGYELVVVKLFDFYPQTGHIESYARFRWKR